MYICSTLFLISLCSFAPRSISPYKPSRARFARCYTHTSLIADPEFLCLQGRAESVFSHLQHYQFGWIVNLFRLLKGRKSFRVSLTYNPHLHHSNPSHLRPPDLRLLPQSYFETFQEGPLFRHRSIRYLREVGSEGERSSTSTPNRRRQREEAQKEDDRIITGTLTNWKHNDVYNERGGKLM